MSIFPKRATRGQLITIHHRSLAFSGRISIRTSLSLGRLHTPDEQCIELFKKSPIDLPISPASTLSGSGRLHHHPRNEISNDLAREVVAELARTVAPGKGGFPQKLIGKKVQERLAGDGLSRVLADLLVLELSSHAYEHWRVPKDAQLGRYHFELESWNDGHCSRSRNVETDDFFIEHIDVSDLKVGESARLRNPGPEPVVATIIQPSFYNEPDNDASAYQIELPPRDEVVVELKSERALLRFAEGSGLLFLVPPQTEFPWRNPFLTWERRPAGGQVVLKVPPELRHRSPSTRDEREALLARMGLHSDEDPSVDALLRDGEVALSPLSSHVWMMADGLGQTRPLLREEQETQVLLLSSGILCLRGL